MRSSSAIKLTGFRELEKALVKLGPKVSRSVTNKAMTAARKPVVKAIRGGAPKSDGDLKKSIGHKAKTYKRNTTRLNIIGARSKTINRDGRRKNPALYAHLVEFGTKPHGIGSGKVLTLTTKSHGRNAAGQYATTSSSGFVTGPVSHPGSKPQPFMRKGWQKSKRTALARFIKSYRSGVARSAKAVR